MLTKEEEKKYPRGTAIPQEQVDKWFKEDTEKALKEVEKMFPKMKGEARNILQNMVFTLGGNKLDKFTDLKKALNKKNPDYEAAAKAMVDSDWFEDVGNRSKRLVKRMKSIKGNK